MHQNVCCVPNHFLTCCCSVKNSSDSLNTLCSFPVRKWNTYTWNGHMGTEYGKWNTYTWNGHMGMEYGKWNTHTWNGDMGVEHIHLEWGHGDMGVEHIHLEWAHGHMGMEYGSGTHTPGMETWTWNTELMGNGIFFHGYRVPKPTICLGIRLW